MIGVWVARPIVHGAKSHGLIQRNAFWIFCVVELLVGSPGALLE
jgi:hypothetical protein